ENSVPGKQIFLWILGIAVIIVIIFFAGWDIIKSAFLRANIYVLGSLFLLQTATLAMSAYKWHYLLKKLHARIRFRETFGIFLAGSFVESVTPSSKLGGEAVKVYLFRRHTSLPYQKLTAALLVDKYVTLLPFAILCVLSVSLAAVSFKLPSILYSALLTLSAVVLLLYLLYRTKTYPEVCLEKIKTAQKIEDNMLSQVSAAKKFNLRLLIAQKGRNAHLFFEEAICYSRKLISVKERYWLFSISLLVWILYPLKIYVVALMLGFNVEPLFAAIATYAAYLVSMIPLLPGGLGTFEGSMAFMFTYADFSFAEGLAIALTARLVTFWFPLILSGTMTAYLIWRENDLLRTSELGKIDKVWTK
ncbi:flippase-like domain-containing protein, partial [Thermodesulfovibrionales bacterium]|nr:flippase-like domain-containing protein [Thermodesulfovibrionales bacterium]